MPLNKKKDDAPASVETMINSHITVLTSKAHGSDGKQHVCKSVMLQRMNTSQNSK